MLQAVHGWSSTYERFVKSQKFFSSYLTQEDLSRLGRDMRESSYYAEQFFPEHDIHYIAIGDNFDTERENIMAPFLFAMNEVYLRDGSRKVKDILRSKRQNGQYCACPPYGYGDVAPATFTVTNSTGGSINLGAPTLSGANTASFEINAAGLPQTLASGESATFTVRPKTGLAAGSYTAQVQLVAEDGAGTSQTLAAAVNFTVTPPVWRVGVAASPAGAGVCLVNGAEVSETGVEDGSSVTLTAKENAGYRFLRWENEQGQTLTTDKEYIVHPTADMQLQMVFEKLVYAITATPGTLEFEPRVAGYAAAPDARTVTVENTGNTEVTLALPTAQGYDIQAGSGFANGQATLAAGGTATFTVQPKTGLAAGNYARAINVAGTNGASAVVNAAFTVEPALALTAPATLAGGGKLTLTANKGADSVVCTTDAAYNPTAAAGGTTWTVTLPQTPGTYTFEATRTTAYGGKETATCTVTVTEKAAETGGQESQNTGRKPNPKTGVKAAH